MRVVQTVRQCAHLRTPRGHRMHVRLLLSIDRSGTQAEAAETVDLAHEFSQKADPIVAGLDFSGNPLRSSFVEFASHFGHSLGLPASVHVGEKADDGVDLDAVLLHFRPERIGHVVCLEPRHVQALLDKPIPIEICPTSNLKTKIVAQLEQHPFGTWRQRNNHSRSSSSSSTALASAAYPLVVCTDDSGVFHITLSSELHRLAEAFPMGRDELLQLERQALEHGFADEAYKAELRRVFTDFTTQDTLPVDPRPVAVLTCAGLEQAKAGDRALLEAFAEQGLAAVMLACCSHSSRSSML